MTTGASRALAALLVIVLIGVGYFVFTRKESVAVSDYASCVSAGYAPTDSVPAQCQTPDGRVFIDSTVATTTDPGTQPGTSNGTTTTVGTGTAGMIRVTNVSANQTVSSPLVVEGEARGTYYFEASFPVELIDANGKRLAIAPAQAKGEWMTTNFVPFSVTLTFAQPTTQTGTLILMNDNPSGLPENAREMRIPVKFSNAQRAVKLYYYNSSLDKDASGNILCSSKGLVAVNRTIPVTMSPIKDTLNLFLSGNLTASERAQGITTEYPLQGVGLTSASLSSAGALTIALSDPNNRTGGGSCRIAVLRAQLEATARQFPEVKSVTVTPDTLFQP